MNLCNIAQDTFEITRGKYKIVYADPPWKYSNKATRGNADKQYSTLALEELKTLMISDIRVQELGADDSVLALWTTRPMLPDALSLMQSWGYQYKTMWTWVKFNKRIRHQYVDEDIFFGIGNYTRSNAEDILIGFKGKGLKAINKNYINVQFHERLSHSEKPNLFRRMLVDIFGDVPRIELFARQRWGGWDVWGNEV